MVLTRRSYIEIASCFFNGGKGKVFQNSTNVSVARELTTGPWQHLTTIRGGGQFQQHVYEENDINLGLLVYFEAKWANFRIQGNVKKSVLGSIHVVVQLLFSTVLSILTFNFDLFFLLFGALMGYFWGWGRLQKPFRGLLI